MSKLLKILKEKPLTLVVHLPENKVELAQAAERAGAEALMIDQGFDEDKILKAVKIPVGLNAADKVTGENKYDFVNFPVEALPEFGKLKKIARIAELNESYTLDKLMQVVEGTIDALDAAIIPLHQFGKELQIGDLQNYIAIALSSNLPVIIPTQRNIKPSEVAIIWDTGVKGLMLTRVVLGETAKSFEKAVKEYRIAIDDLG
ncbi:hypothetical protein HZC35_07455 [Candidatus Saganbacteria bacterium]|nr:hypothetical protein [Candidatus Saganbacteria bacterium]